MAKKTKTLAAVSAVTTVNSNQTLVLADTNGAVTRITLGNLKTALLAGIDLNAIEDGVFIMYHRNRDNLPLAAKPHKWPAIQSGGEVAEGVLIVEGGRMLVVAPTETSLYWSSANVSGGGTTTSDRLTGLNDWNGKGNTAAQVKHSECSSASYAPGFCNAYSRTNANGKGLTAGRWWLPSVGELMMMYANMCKINYALSLINGASQLAEEGYWSSTETSSALAWIVYFSVGGVDAWSAKVSYLPRVRPVSAFLI